ncbi:unnamed protein product [Citrullus colocynthis]|uniref:Uncharacterized protein n=1 Tax=Citrullus colocynthis TaxID=252529 RepID=A0ABP0Z633_9ROSI
MKHINVVIAIAAATTMTPHVISAISATNQHIYPTIAVVNVDGCITTALEASNSVIVAVLGTLTTSLATVAASVAKAAALIASVASSFGTQPVDSRVNVNLGGDNILGTNGQNPTNNVDPKLEQLYINRLVDIYSCGCG